MVWLCQAERRWVTVHMCQFSAACTGEVYVNLCIVNEEEPKHAGCNHHICFSSLRLRLHNIILNYNRICLLYHRLSSVKLVLYSLNKSVFVSTQGSCFDYCLYCGSLITWHDTWSRDFSCYLSAFFIFHIFQYELLAVQPNELACVLVYYIH